MIFDTHCHLGYDGEDPEPVRQRAAEAQVSLILNVGIDLDSSERARKTSTRLDAVHYSAGLHPNDASKLEVEWPAIETLCRRDDCLAVGETGLDFYRDWTTPEQQVPAFERHLALARELDRPVIVHCREAFQRCYQVLADFPGIRGVMHCFSAGMEEARQALDLGFYLSFAGPLTYPKSEALRAAAEFAPADRILVETDAPFLPPQFKRGKRNEPAFIVKTVERLAEVRGIEFAEAARITKHNGERLFGLGLAQPGTDSGAD